jgi:PTH1 family peptidyl-tRNA hydrolase
MKLIVGLGNPGEEYALTRHNVGFMVLKELAKEHSIKFKIHKRLKTFVGEGLIEGESCYLAMPQTFMNLSGNSVRSIVSWLKVRLDEILLIIDDIAIPFGNIRIRAKGSDAGHRGLKSVISCLGTNEFSRMRIGIMAGKVIKDYSRYVLSKFTKKEEKALVEILKRASQACECWVREGVDVAMNKYNSAISRKL